MLPPNQACSACTNIHMAKSTQQHLLHFALQSSNCHTQSSPEGMIWDCTDYVVVLHETSLPTVSLQVFVQCLQGSGKCGHNSILEPGSAHCTAHVNATFNLLLRQHPSQVQKSICTTAGFRNQFEQQRALVLCRCWMRSHRCASSSTIHQRKAQVTSFLGSHSLLPCC